MNIFTFLWEKKLKLGFCAIGLMVLGSCDKPDQNNEEAPDSLLYVWMSDEDAVSSSFLAVVNADAASEGYGKVLSTVPVGTGNGGAHQVDDECEGYDQADVDIPEP